MRFLCLLATCALLQTTALAAPRGWSAHFGGPFTVHAPPDWTQVDRPAAIAAWEAVWHRQAHARRPPLPGIRCALRPSRETAIPCLVARVVPVPSGPVTVPTGDDGGPGKRFAWYWLHQADAAYPGWVIRQFPVARHLGTREFWLSSYDVNAPTLALRVRCYTFLLPHRRGLVLSYVDRQPDVLRHAVTFDRVVSTLTLAP